MQSVEDQTRPALMAPPPAAPYSIALYCMWPLLKGWLMQSVHTHLGRSFFEGTYGSVWPSLLWGICYWMYRRGIFLGV